MTKTILLGASLAALFAVGMVSTIFAVNAGQFDIESASTDGETLTMTVAEKIKQIPENKADDLITFYAWVTITDDGLEADAITIHHGVNDHQAFGKAAQSSPVQSYHPHGVSFDSDFCIVGLDSPKAKFKVQHDTVTLESENSFDFAATGTVGPRSECTATGLGITNLYDTL
ncbi:hypothetical protein YTPLAS73_10380 [Nitrosarchaeum sp.]|nr:hypothetical protein YTPLAS73_10380 [Nitrosarchaeum sp.]